MIFSCKCKPLSLTALTGVFASGLIALCLAVAPASAVTLGGAGTGFFDNATAEYDQATGTITSWVVGGTEQLGVGGFAYYARINDNAEFRIAPGSTFVDPSGVTRTLQFDGLTVRNDLFSGVAVGVAATYSVAGLFDEIEVQHTMLSVGLDGSPSQTASLDSTVDITVSADATAEFGFSLFEFINYDLNNDTNLAETATETANAAVTGNTPVVFQEDGTTNANTVSTGLRAPQPDTIAGNFGVIPPQVDIDDASSILASLSDGSPTNVTNQRNDTGDFAQLFQTDSTLLADRFNTQIELSYNATKRLETGAEPEPGIIPEPGTTATIGLGLLALCNFLTKRSCRR